MKKYFILVFSMIIAYQGLNAITSQEIITELQTQADKYKEALNTSISMPAQVRSERLNNWKNAFDKAKKFVQDNSKTMGIKDSDLTNAIVALDKAYMNLMDIVPKISTMTTGIQLDQMKQALALIFQNINKTIENLKKVKFTLSHKIQAQNVILSMGKILKEIIATSNDTINAQKQSIAPALPPRSAQTKPTQNIPAPSTPPTRALPTIPTSTSTGKFVMTSQMKSFFEKELSPTEGHLVYIQRLLVAHGGFAIGSNKTMIQNEAQLQKVFETLLTKFKNAFLNELKKFGTQDIGITIGSTLSEMIVNSLKQQGLLDVQKGSQESILIDGNLVRAIYQVFPNGRV